MDIEKYRFEMKNKLRMAREELDNKNVKMNLHINHVRHLSIKKYDALRDGINEIDKKLDRFYELDTNLHDVLKEDIDDLWKHIKLLLDI